MKSRKKALQLLKNAIKKTVRNIAPEKVVLFGSYAYGRPNKDSDIDLLLIVNNTKLTGLKRYAWATEDIEHFLPMDILVKTPMEVEKRISMGDPFYKEIIAKGKVIYEAAK
jgi:uncharacterized protein